MKRYYIYRSAGRKISKPPIGVIQRNEKINILLETDSFIIVEMTPETKEEFRKDNTDLTVVENVPHLTPAP